MDEKLKKVIFIVLGCFVILFLFLFVMSSCTKKISPSKFETEIVESAKYYYSNHKDELPSTNSVLTLSLSDLVSKGIIDELDKILEDGTTCSGSLTIENNNNYYMYSPKLDCTSNSENYKTETLKDLLLEDLVSSGNGLYSMNGGYYYRGDNIDNYVIFDGLLWRATKINSDNSIRLIEVERREAVVWDDRYNDVTTSTTGINNFYYNNLNSRIKDTLDEIYNSENVLTNDSKGFIKETSLCVGKRNILDTTKDGSVECASMLHNQYLGLLQLNEYLIASLDTNCVNASSTACSNYNYLADLPNSYWTLTADDENTNKVFKINQTVMTTGASNSAMPRLVINISENTNVSGEGSLDKPYVVSGLATTLRSEKK